MGKNRRSEQRPFCESVKDFVKILQKLQF